MKAKRAYLKEERIMEKIHINLGSDSYDVHIESGLIDKAGSAIADLTGAEKAAVITEDTIDKLYGMRLVSSLEKAGIKAKMIVVPGTENPAPFRSSTASTERWQTSALEMTTS